MPGIFFGSKISGLCTFLGLQNEAPSDPPVMYTSSTPPPGSMIMITVRQFYDSVTGRLYVWDVRKNKTLTTAWLLWI